MALISVIIPVYNMEKYLQDCLESVAAQSLADIEIICVNDGSTDGSRGLIEAWQARDSRILLLNQENLGSAAARNRGIKTACGKYIAFMDPDDRYPDENVLKALYTAAEENNVRVCGGGLDMYFKERRQRDFKGSGGFRFEKEGLLSYRDYQFDHGYTRFLYNREFLLAEGLFFPNYRRYMDAPFFVRTMLAAEKFYALPRTVYCYRTGHEKEFVFTPDKVNDFVRGLREVLLLAAENGLDKLFALEAARLDSSLVPIISTGISCDNPELLKLLLTIDDIIRKKTGAASAISKELINPINAALARKRARQRCGMIFDLLLHHPAEFAKHAAGRLLPVINKKH